MIVRLLYFEAMKSVQEENQRLIATQLAVLDKQRQSDFFDGEDFVELKLDQIDQDVELQEVSFEFENQLRKMAGLYPAIGRQQIDWNFGQILSVDRVGIIVDSLYDQQAVPTTLLYREQQIELAHRELQLEKSNVNIGFLQTQYQPYRIEQDRNPWSISLGVTIPIANPNKGDMTKRRLEVIEAEHKRTDTESAIQVDQMVAREQLRSLIARYREIRKKTEALDVPGLSGSLQAMKENNPVVSLRLAGNVLKLKMLEVKIRQNILLTYIAFLGYTDVIQREPLINFLTDELEHIGW
jgi:hypothetical protein